MHRLAEYPDAGTQTVQLTQSVAGELTDAIAAKGYATSLFPVAPPHGRF